MGVRWGKGDEAQGTHLHASTATMIPPLDNCSSEAFLTCLARSKPRSLDHCSAGALLACQTRSLTCLLDHCNTEAFLLTTRLVLQTKTTSVRQPSTTMGSRATVSQSMSHKKINTQTSSPTACRPPTLPELSHSSVFSRLII